MFVKDFWVVLRVDDFVPRKTLDIWVGKFAELTMEFAETLRDHDERINALGDGGNVSPLVIELHDKYDVLIEINQKTLERITKLEKKYGGLYEKRKWEFRGKQGGVIRFVCLEYLEGDKPWIDMLMENVYYLITKDHGMPPESSPNLDRLDIDVNNMTVPGDLIRSIEKGEIEHMDKLRLNLGVEVNGSKEKNEVGVDGEILNENSKKIISYLKDVGREKTGDVKKAMGFKGIIFLNEVDKLKRMGEIREVEIDGFNYLELMDENNDEG